MKFVELKLEPGKTNKYFIHTSKGGLNSCILIDGNSCIPNCVGYAWGRAYMAWGVKPKLSRGDAKLWYGYTDGYKRSQTPKVGSIICWLGGQYGHVAFVEKVSGDSITITESAYGSYKWRTRTLKKPYNFGSYKTQGFILPPVTFEENKPKETTPTLKVGSKVKVMETAKVYGKAYKFSSWVYKSTFYVREINGNRVVIAPAKTGDITGAVDKKFLKLVG